MEPQTQTIEAKNQKLRGIADLGFTHPDGLPFSYWTTDREGEGPRYYDEEPVILDDSITLYAQWGKEWVVKFNSMGGTSVPSRLVETGNAVGTLPTTTRTEYNFQGWWTASSNGSRVTAETVINEPATFYAHWNAVVHEGRRSKVEFDNGNQSPSIQLFSNIPAGRFKLVMEQMKMSHYGHKAGHKIFFNLKAENKNATREYTYLAMSDTNTSFPKNPGRTDGKPSEVNFDTRGWHINGKTEERSQMYAVGGSGTWTTGYFNCQVIITLPYSRNNLYVWVDPTDTDNCSGLLDFLDGKKTTLTKID